MVRLTCRGRVLGSALVRGHEVVRRLGGGQRILQELDLRLLVRRIALRVHPLALVMHPSCFNWRMSVDLTSKCRMTTIGPQRWSGCCLFT